MNAAESCACKQAEPLKNTVSLLSFVSICFLYSFSVLVII